jgi:hypothetical protein
MRFTIIKDSNLVVVGGVGFSVDCSALPEDFHALQWEDTHGEIEFKMTRCTHCGARSKKGNETISDVSPYKSYFDAWDVARRYAAEADAQARAKIADAPAGPQS